MNLDEMHAWGIVVFNVVGNFCGDVRGRVLDKFETRRSTMQSALLYFVAALCGYGAAAFVPSLTLDRSPIYPHPPLLHKRTMSSKMISPLTASRRS